MAQDSKIQNEIDSNYEAFLKMLPSLLDTDHNRWALVRHGELEAVFDTAVDAQTAGKKMFGDELFSTQQVTNQAIDLGWFSHAVPER